MTNYLHMSQADPLWAAAKMNVGTFRRSACLVTCLAMKFSGETGRVITPLELDAYLDTHKGYAKGSDVLVWDVAIAFAQSKGLGYTKCEFVTEIGGMRHGEIMKVTTARGTGHFVLFVGEGLAMTILDPGTMQPDKWRTTWPAAGYTPKEIRRLV